ncbi:hypothetical protein EGW08_018436 [Elysia chlorotica]|uniref:Dermatopontin n=1 Tax=Elysia chlorotica TaxID=188477 RepID=A0A433SWW4_ELYCH|nr:hypothetical protein EGW08_018436 [Elysia chlorotica]
MAILSVSLSILLVAVVLALYTGEAKAWDTKYDEPFEYNCPSGQVLYRLKSIHHNRHEDRKWDFSCRPAPGGANPRRCLASNYANDLDRELNFQCNSDHMITGIYSFHNNAREDRRFRFKCCSDENFSTSDCRYTSYINNFDGYMNFAVPQDKIIVGAYSVHDNHSE